MSDERESGGGSGALIAVVLVVILGGGLVLLLGVGGLFLFTVRSHRSAAGEVEAREMMQMMVERERAAAEAQAAAQATAAASQALNSEAPAFALEINAAGEYLAGGETLTADEMETLLKKVQEDTPDQSIAVRTDKDAPIEAVTKLLDALKRVGVTKYQLTTEGKPE